MTDEHRQTVDAGREAHRRGDFAAAEKQYRRAIELRPDDMDSTQLLGTVLLQQGRYEDCVECLKLVVESRPHVVDALNNLGVAHQVQGHWEEAARAFEAAIRVNPEYGEAWFNLGSVVEKRGLFADAEKCFRRAMELRPEDTHCRQALALSQQSQQKWAEAAENYHVLTSGPADNDNLRVNLAYVLAMQERLDESAAMYEGVVARNADFYQVHNSLGYIYERQGRLDEAAAAAERAIAISPDYADGYNNLGAARRSQLRLTEAVAAFSRALELQPDFPLAEFNLATTHLLNGDFAAGFGHYESRARVVSPSVPERPQRRWDGRPIPGQTLLVYSDQGFGDTLQFVRLLPRVREQSRASIRFACQPALLSLFQAGLVLGDVDVVGDDVDVEADASIPLATLPGVLGLNLDDLPIATDYVRLAAQSSGELPLPAKTVESHPRVGLVWQGNPDQARDMIRSCPFESIEPLFDVDGIHWVSLQTGFNVANLPGHVDELGTALSDFRTTAEVMHELDLVITVDTAMAHLAGAMGFPVWTVLCAAPDWRWLLERADSPWYPSMRLFRQPAWGDWTSVVSDVRDALQEWRDEVPTERT